MNLSEKQSECSDSEPVKSDQSKDDAPNFSEETPSPTRSGRSGSVVFSSVSVKSNQSKSSVPNFSEKQPSSAKSDRSCSPVSKRSKRSKDDGPNLREKKTSSTKSERSGSPDQSKGDEPNLSEKKTSSTKRSSPTTVQIVGGTGGFPFSFTGQKNGASLEKIGVWEGEWQVKAVKVWLSDGRSETFGNPDGPYQEYVFKLGECFTSLSLWDNGERKRLGGIKFKTNQGGNFFAKMTKNSLPTEIPMDVGSGYCLGVVGNAGADIDRMGFLFLSAVQSAVLTNVSYPTIHQLIPKVTMEEIKSVTYRNNSSAKQQQTIESSKKVTNKSSWSMSKSFTATFSMDVKAGIPGILEVSTGFSVSIESESTYGLELTDERTETLSTTVDVPPKKKVDVDISIGRATFDLLYTGTVKITCKNGSVLEYETNGQYKGVTYTDIKVDTKESDL